MGKLWCEGVPTVSVPHVETPTPLTLIVPYYENRAFLGAQIVHWRTLPEKWRKHLSVIVVDDGSPYHPAEEVVARFHPTPFLRLFRIEVDVRWNWLAARNIGAHHAADGWLLLTDMDHVLPVATFDALIYGQHDPSCVYVFPRTEHTGEEIAPHSASFYMTRKTFWKIGGYDEALSGHYGTDGEYRRRLAKVAGLRLLKHGLVRHEYQGDSSTMRYKRKQPEDAGVRRIVAARRVGWKPKVLSFPYHEVLV